MDTQVEANQADTATTEHTTETTATTAPSQSQPGTSAEPDEEPELAPCCEPPTDEELRQVHAPAKPGRGKFSGMSVAELQAK